MCQKKQNINQTKIIRSTTLEYLSKIRKLNSSISINIFLNWRLRWEQYYRSTVSSDYVTHSHLFPEVYLHAVEGHTGQFGFLRARPVVDGQVGGHGLSLLVGKLLPVKGCDKEGPHYE